jgi:hypothetical protein
MQPGIPRRLTATHRKEALGTRNEAPKMARSEPRPALFCDLALGNKLGCQGQVAISALEILPCYFSNLEIPAISVTIGCTLSLGDFLDVDTVRHDAFLRFAIVVGP